MSATTLFDGIVQHTVTTPRLTANVLERPGGDRTIVFVHGNCSSSLFWQPAMLALPADVRAIAIDLRGFGDSQVLPVNASRGVRDFSDDVESVVNELGLESFGLVGWSLGGGVVMQYVLDHPERVSLLGLVSPVSPYGFGGTAADGSLLDPAAPGTGGGGANPDFVARLAAGDTTDEAPTSPRTVFRTAYVKHPENHTEWEDVWVASMLTTATGVDNYPGDSVAVEAWPGFGPGTRGVLNTLAPTNFTTTAIVDLDVKPPVLWFRGADDAIVSDTSFFDLNFLGTVGAIPGWPGADVAPAQPMVSQTRAVLDRYAANGGAYEEIVYEETGHSTPIERTSEFAAALSEALPAA